MLASPTPKKTWVRQSQIRAQSYKMPKGFGDPLTMAALSFVSAGPLGSLLLVLYARHHSPEKGKIKFDDGFGVLEAWSGQKKD